MVQIPNKDYSVSVVLTLVHEVAGANSCNGRRTSARTGRRAQARKLNHTTATEPSSAMAEWPLLEFAPTIIEQEHIL